MDSSGALRLPGAAAFIAAFAGTLSTTMLTSISPPLWVGEAVNPRRKECALVAIANPTGSRGSQISSSDEYPFRSLPRWISLSHGFWTFF